MQIDERSKGGKGEEVAGKDRRARPKNTWELTVKKDPGELSLTEELWGDRREWRFRKSRLDFVQCGRRARS